MFRWFFSLFRNGKCERPVDPDKDLLEFVCNRAWSTGNMVLSSVQPDGTVLVEESKDGVVVRREILSKDYSGRCYCVTLGKNNGRESEEGSGSCEDRSLAEPDNNSTNRIS